MIKRRHHYVWQQYLKSFCYDGLNLFCLINNEVKQLPTVNIGVEKDIYRLIELSKYELYFLQKAFVDNREGSLQIINRNWIDAFTYLQKVKSKYTIEELPKTLIESIKQVEHNLSEDMHMHIEYSGIKYLEKLSNKDISFYNDPDMCAEFVFYFLIQYFRTRKMRDSIIDGDFKGLIDPGKMVNILVYLLSTIAGMRLIDEREKWEIIGIENNTGIPFITCDQPIINLYVDYLKSKTQLSDDQMEFYYPITPHYAIVYKRKDHNYFQYQSNNLEIINKLNTKVFEATHIQTYSIQKNVLSQYIKEI